MIHYTFILVEPEEDANVGAAARALNVMGHHDLRLVRPKANPKSGKARALAHGSQDILKNAQTYKTLAAALEDIDFACASTARHRQEKYHYVSARELPQHLRAKGDALKRVAIVFGSESSGLSGKDLAQCDLLTTIPQSCTHPSLNLAQAVMVFSFILAEEQTTVQIQDQRLEAADAMPTQQYANLKNSTLRLMERVGLSERVQNQVMKGIALLGRDELYLLHRIRNQIDRTLDRLESTTRNAEMRASQESRSDD